jgi:hypothetical protein
MWVNQNHALPKCWQDSEGNGDLKHTLAKEDVYLFCMWDPHKPDSLTSVNWHSGWHKICTHNTDYHKGKNAIVFNIWYMKFLDMPHMSQLKNVVTVIDNTSYHSVLLRMALTTSSRECKIINWLQKNNVCNDLSHTRNELHTFVWTNITSWVWLQAPEDTQ